MYGAFAPSGLGGRSPPITAPASSPVSTGLSPADNRSQISAGGGVQLASVRVRMRGPDVAQVSPPWNESPTARRGFSGHQPPASPPGLKPRHRPTHSRSLRRGGRDSSPS